jgi:hypothetical protein
MIKQRRFYEFHIGSCFVLVLFCSGLPGISPSETQVSHRASSLDLPGGHFLARLPGVLGLSPFDHPIRGLGGKPS